MPWTRDALVGWQQRVDPLADAATEGMGPGAPQMLWEQVVERAELGHQGARVFIEQTRELPTWCDAASLERGRAIVVELGMEMALVLTAGGLIEGYAAPSLSTPLIWTGRLKTDAARRLYETGQMVHNARAPGGLAPDGLGRRTVLQVRVLHSVVRRHLESKGYVGPDGGRAIHQLDMAHTATTFSHKGLEKLPHLGIHLTPAERFDVHHFFRVVNHLHGVDEALLPETPRETAEFTDFLDAWRFDLDFAEGAELARAALRGLAGEPPFFLPEAALTTLACLCMSAEQAERWGLQSDPWWSRLFAGLARGNRLATGTTRRFRSLGKLRARASVALYGRTLVARLGNDPARRAFGMVAGEEHTLGPGLERPSWMVRAKV
ncbi:MAG: hypothetical protein CL927_16640 [Deltaproteobacteria bacterium]|nr:hypothetical protein [Deltaproteobacteria bacterium]HCH65096.1 hypothetical protein [Deltaproteobacteria bacterium]